jgi:hypothetical protein
MEIRDSGETAPAKYEKRKCGACSLVDWCMPRSAGAGGKEVDRYIQSQLRFIEKFGSENFDCEKSFGENSDAETS